MGIFILNVKFLTLSVGSQVKMGINLTYGDNPHMWGFRLMFKCWDYPQIWGLVCLQRVLLPVLICRFDFEIFKEHVTTT